MNSQAMVATGASASVPPVPGLKEIPHLTNSNFWNLEELPKRMGVIGAGPIGLEMAQSMQRFGCEVSSIGSDFSLISIGGHPSAFV